MIHSMTGYGEAQHVRDGVSYALNIRTVNGRYIKLSIRLPEHLQSLEHEVEKVLRARVARGSVSCSLQIRSEDQPVFRTINKAALQHYVDAMGQVRVPGGLQATMDLASLTMLPGVCEPVALDDAARQGQLETVLELTHRALDAVIRMRSQEGEALCRDLLHHLGAIRAELDTIGTRAPNVIEEYHERLRTRVAALMRESRVELEADSLTREIAIFAERSDVAEEITRMFSHLEQFEQLCNRGEQVGRTLDFLAQELLREVNTIGSKSNDAAIARSVVEIKGRVDRLKEQVQNVE
ncbi:MAG: YicC family protein [Planctomycetes bacterium]|nr:YicC family protein [Planctomycetota bacterium]